MTKQLTPAGLYTIAERAIPEPGMNKPAVMVFLETANTFLEGPIQYIAQLTAEITRQILSQRHTLHETINDYEFSRRLLDALKE